MERDFLECEIKRLLVEKWLEGERIHADPGDSFMLKMIEEHGPEWRDLWPRCSCKDCRCLHDCGWKMIVDCPNKL